MSTIPVSKAAIPTPNAEQHALFNANVRDGTVFYSANTLRNLNSGRLESTWQSVVSRGRVQLIATLLQTSGSSVGRWQVIVHSPIEVI